MAQTIIITGCSTGIGRATAHLFAEKGWNVVASMRDPKSAGDLSKIKNVLVVPLDVTETKSINTAVKSALKEFKTIDVLVNNAGYGAYGPLEATPREKIVRQFHTNVIGLIDVTKTLIPHFRERKSGMIVNISSIGGRIGMPIGSLYHSTKFAVEGLSEAMMYEMETIGVRVKIVEPGLVDTDFNSRSIDISNDESLTDYQPLIQRLVAGSSDPNTYRPGPELTAGVIWEAVTDGTKKLRYPSGDDAIANLSRRKQMDDEEFLNSMRERFGL